MNHKAVYRAALATSSLLIIDVEIGRILNITIDNMFAKPFWLKQIYFPYQHNTNM